MKVVITGGAGFIGLSICRRLLEIGSLTGPSGKQQVIDSIVLFDAHVPVVRPDGLDERVHMVRGDIADPGTVMSLIDRDDVSLFHLASVVSGGGEKDFDLAMRVNLDGGRHILEAARARATTPRVVFASSVAIYGGSAMPDVVFETTRAVPQTTYGMTKVIGELMINDYTRKGFIDGRTARLPTVIIRPGTPNAAASSFCSGLFREPLQDQPCALPVDRSTRMPLIGYRNCIEGFIALHEIDGGKLGEDRALNLPSLDCTVADMVAAVTKVAKARGIELGPITDNPDAAISAIVSSWATRMNSDRALKLGLPADESLEQVVEDFIDDFL
ncbi:MAG: NAD-dependent epimerase/dehydratase family protein [Rhodospirillales bacterium]|nr:NAD-dependent epimerase/dehydratase family protein [Rhodospirillales bacterium]